MAKHYVFEVGTDIVFDTGALIGTSTVQNVQFKSPSGTKGTFSGELFSSFSDLAQDIGTYFVLHTLGATDFNESGDWRLHAFVAAIDGTWLSELVILNVLDKYE